jgi:ABC-type multidrug transport system fused ATPase/permease subunit
MAHVVAAPVSRGKRAGAHRFALAGCAAFPISILEDEKRMAGDPHRHTKSEGLKRLLRRRGRRTKPRANSGKKVYSWAEYSQVNFTPTGHQSRIGWILVGAMFATWFGILLFLNIVGRNFPGSYDTILFWLIIAGGAIAAIAFVLGLMIFLYSSARTIFDLLAEYRKRKAAQDEAANRVR